MFFWDRLIDDKIKTAQENGLFDNLAGAGKPLVDDGEDQSSPDWLGNHLLRQAGFLPNWLQLRKEVSHDRPAVVAALKEYRAFEQQARAGHRGDQALLDRLEERYIQLATAINKKIDEHNHWCPSIHVELVRFREDIIAYERARRRGY